MAEVQTLLLSDLDHIQARVSASERLARVLAGFRDRAEGRGDGPPPIGLLTRGGRPCALYDGNHRLTAARMLGLESIDAFVEEITPPTPKHDRPRRRYDPGPGWRTEYIVVGGSVRPPEEP